MNARTWTASAGGSTRRQATADHPNLVSLTSAGEGFEQFDSLPSPSVPAFTLVFASEDPFAFYVEVRTSNGRRQFKFEPGEAGTELRFGYRYQVGLGSDARDGTTRATSIDLSKVAEAVEPDTIIEAVIGVFVRLAGTLFIDLLEGDPPVPPADGEITRTEAVRFLTQATFGPSEATIAELQELASFDRWIDDQLEAPVSRTEPYVRANSNGSLATTRHMIWWINAIEGRDQLRQRVAFALSQIFVVSDFDYELRNAQYAMSGYYDMLASDGLGNFRDLIEKVTLHPVMGIYLSMLRNEKADPARNVRPDENYAREILQLFTIGLYQLTPDGEIRMSGNKPIPTYSQTTVEEFAKVFTGWNLADADVWQSNDLTKFDKERPMVPVEEYHDRSEKTLLQGATVGPGLDARTELGLALDNIFAHQNVGPFVSRLLIQRLVTSNPSPGYVGRVAARFDDNGDGERGDMAAVVRAILTDPEARNGHLSAPDTFGKIKEPVLRLTQLWRAFDVEPGTDADGVYRPKARAIDQIGDVLGQAPMRSPSVFNFFQPDHRARPGSDIVAPEAQILTEVDLASTNNMLFLQIYNGNNRTQDRTNIATINIDREIAMADDVDALIDHLDVLLVAGRLPVAQHRAIAAHLTRAHAVVGVTADEALQARIQRVLDAMFCIVGSPVHLVQK